MPLKIDTNSCDRCGTCISVCPGDALLLLEHLTVEAENCTECSTCVDICPIGSLSIDQKA